MKDSRKKLGRLGEDLAVAYLQEQGYAIHDRNYRHSTLGEIDIVGVDGECLAFVEVRTRRGRDFGTPEESITPAKQQKLIELAQAYLQEHEGEPLPPCWRIDVVAVELTSKGKLQRVELIKNAVTG